MKLNIAGFNDLEERLEKEKALFARALQQQDCVFVADSAPEKLEFLLYIKAVTLPEAEKKDSSRISVMYGECLYHIRRQHFADLTDLVGIYHLEFARSFEQAKEIKSQMMRNLLIALPQRFNLGPMQLARATFAVCRPYCMFNIVNYNSITDEVETDDNVYSQNETIAVLEEDKILRTVLFVKGLEQYPINHCIPSFLKHVYDKLLQGESRFAELGPRETFK